MCLKTNNKNENPHNLHPAGETDYLHLRRVRERSSALQYPHFPDFCVHYVSALKKIICIFSYISPNNILFNLALLGGTLCKCNHAESIIRFAPFDIIFGESSTLMCLTVVHVLALW